MNEDNVQRPEMTIPTPEEIHRIRVGDTSEDMKALSKYIIPHLMQYKGSVLVVQPLPVKNRWAYPEFQRHLAERGWKLWWDNDSNPAMWNISEA